MSDNKKQLKENASSKSAKKDGKDSKGGFFSRVGKFFKEYRSELKKISWPTFSEVVKNTLITLAVVLMVGIVVWLVDWGVGTLRDTFITKAEKTDLSELTSKTDVLDEVENIVQDVASVADAGIDITEEAIHNAVSGADVG